MLYYYVVSWYINPILRFEYLQATSGKLVRPNVPPNHEWSGDKVQRLSGQGDIYIKPSYPFSMEVSFIIPHI